MTLHQLYVNEYRLKRRPTAFLLQHMISYA